MIIRDEINNITIRVGQPSINHVQISDNGNMENAVTIHRAVWNEVKEKIDKMFKVAEGI